jgi:serine-type D-Ala-D-Ala carboxypeptidase/endopeptidase (penicillin-binding protein 4)
MRWTRGAKLWLIGMPDYREAAPALHGPGGPSSVCRRPIAGSRIWAFLAALAVALVLAGPSGAGLRDALSRALVTPGVSSSATGAFAFDLSRSSIVYRHNQAVSYRPASNEKLTVAVTALDRLGPQFRIPTEVLGEGARNAAGVWQGRLILKGYGDPGLTTRRLAGLAAQVRAAGIVKVTGRIVGDESYFDAVRVGPGWKASYYKEESPPLSALVVNRARVGSRIADEPARAAARLFKAALQAAGVAVPGRVGKGLAGTDAALLADSRSRLMSALVARMDRVSDNFFAEMLLKELGARIRGSGTTAAGARVVRSELRQRGVNLTGVRIADGSGLSSYDRLTARAIGQLLISAVSDTAISSAFVASLPIAGVNGTLKDRMETLPAYRHVFAKTGTTNVASALSGYVTTRYVFAILQNGNPIPWWYARAAQDRFAQVLAGAA